MRTTPHSPGQPRHRVLVGHVGLRLWEGAYMQTDNTSFAGATGDLDVAYDAAVFQVTTTAATGPCFTGS
ncbi:hypothetical protein M2158_004710 [Streptomyces sp. SAI-144]|uniref:hypothetical protein n=1 Tax=unclassified Streptomyces TaxID=2593676 RepID=UPI002476B2E5|nr:MULTISPECIES: hypothetical protein [unclassified Streptomyces]MDH6436170.1 hypothetical protein [Streptomyces sp. SAI-144]MDH6493495.1 hypothetical protein [Streptomyces sp. SAI-127]